MFAGSEKMDGHGKRRLRKCRMREAMNDVAEDVKSSARNGTARVCGEELLRKLASLVRWGNASRIIVRSGETVVADIPVTAGVVSAVLAPWATLAVTVALLGSTLTVEVERPVAPRGGAGARRSLRLPDDEASRRERSHREWASFFHFAT